MAEISAQMVKELRERTGIGMGKCKQALVTSKGDIELAISNLRKEGMASAVKKESREANEGKVVSTENDQALVVVEVNAETDFVVKNEGFQEFAEHTAKQICDTKPKSVEDFLKQKDAQDPNHTVDECRAIVVQTLGENIQIRRFEIFEKTPNSSIAVYSHAGGKLLTLIEIEGSPDMQHLAKDIAMHVAAEAPEYLSPDDVPEKVLEHEKEIARAQMKGKPENIMDKIVAGKMQAFFNQSCLIKQPFVKDSSMTIEKLVESEGSKLGKPLKVTKFLRWSVGQ